eukprot:scaffold39112_cov153-Skeletonema_marinoi.AAC.7
MEITSKAGRRPLFHLFRCVSCSLVLSCPVQMLLRCFIYKEREEEGQKEESYQIRSTVNVVKAATAPGVRREARHARSKSRSNVTDDYQLMDDKKSSKKPSKDKGDRSGRGDRSVNRSRSESKSRRETSSSVSRSRSRSQSRTRSMEKQKMLNVDIYHSLLHHDGDGHDNLQRSIGLSIEQFDAATLAAASIPICEAVDHHWHHRNNKVVISHSARATEVSQKCAVQGDIIVRIRERNICMSGSRND